MKKNIITSQKHCPICSSKQIFEFFELNNIPIFCNVLYNTKAEAINAPKGDLRLAFCQACGHIFNKAYDPKLIEYSQAYENSLHSSPFFQEYAKSLAKELINFYKLYEKNIIEIGCGRGEFLRLLCDHGDNSGIGFDPSHIPEKESSDDTKKIKFIKDYYSEKYVYLKADFICCRHVLEHIRFPQKFMTTIRRSIDNNSSIYFEVPNILYTLRDGGIWDLIYEHYSYYSISSLLKLFNLCGFNTDKIKVLYDEQFLGCWASPAKIDNLEASNEVTNNINEMILYVKEFHKNFKNQIVKWRNYIHFCNKKGQHIVVWGAGSKGVSFLNLLETDEYIPYVVDINPYKQGKYIPGSSQLIIKPEFLMQYRPDLIIVMNSNYRNEIKHTLSKLKINTNILCVSD